MSGRWITVVGIGEDGLDGLSPAARAAVAEAEVLIGGERVLDLIPADGAERLHWRRPIADSMGDIEARRGRRLVVVATGDPLCYGVGETLSRHFGSAALKVFPSPSAFTLACARLGWPRVEVETLSLHARPPQVLSRFFTPGRRLLVLSEDAQTPRVVAELLTARGFGQSRVWVLEHMGGPRERAFTFRAEDGPSEHPADFNTVAIECVAGPNAAIMPQVPGLPDEAFRNDGMLTKREVRAATLARLIPLPHQLLWDVGAGCGSVAIEWLRAARFARATAIERDPARCATIAGNADALGTPELEVVYGKAPDCLAGLEPPDAVFIGGGLRASGLVEACWNALRPRGRLVANAVTVEGEHALLEWQRRFGGELARLSVARVERTQSVQAWRAFAPVTQLAAIKT